MAEDFSSFFSEKITNIRTELTSHDHSFSTNQKDVDEQALSNFRALTSEEVKTIIMKAHTKSCSLDPVPTWLLKECCSELLPIITAIINKSILLGVVPREFKKAQIHPLLKKTGLDPEIKKNYRPVSNLPFLSKVLEKAIDQSLEEHLSQRELHEPCQSACRKFHSTETALLKVVSDITTRLDAGNAVVLVMLDLSAAFDTIDHRILLDRLEHQYGLKGTALACDVYINGELSEPLVLEFGVPQGSVMGPKLYTMYTKPLGAVIRKHGLSYHLYADDTQLKLLYLSCELPQLNNSTVLKAEECIKDTQSWMVYNLLKLNDDKSHHLSSKT